jgi:dienelactone hydrolase
MSTLYLRDDRRFSTTVRLQAYAEEICTARQPLAGDPAALQARNNHFRNTLVNLLGGFPEEKCPLNVVEVFETDLGDHACERIYIDSEPSATVPLLVYRGKRRRSERQPAVILAHGWPQNKEFVPETKRRLVQAGYLVVSYDVLSHGERRVVADTFNNAQNAIGFALALGKPFFGMTTWDIMRVVDYLETREDVDPKRIAIIGLCMGGQQCWYAGALEPRLRVVIPICGTSTYEAMVREMATYHTHCLFTYVPNILRHGDTQDILALIAPRPLLIMNNYNDHWFPVSGYKKVCAELTSVYEALGVPECLRYLMRNTVHDITPEFTDHAVEWLDRWL